MPFTYPYPRPSVTCDVVVFTMHADDLAVLLIQRKSEPFKGKWALPGGFVDENESLERAAKRELAEETGVTGARLEQIGSFGDPGRDPRGHTVTVAYMTLFVAEPKIKAGDDAAAAEWIPLRSLPLGAEANGRGAPAKKRAARSSVQLAFDHAKIIGAAYRRLCMILEDPVRERRFDLLPSRFTLAELQRFYEVVSGRSFVARTFRKNIVDRGLVIAATSKPPAKPGMQLYRWNKR